MQYIFSHKTLEAKLMIKRLKDILRIASRRTI